LIVRVGAFAGLVIVTVPETLNAESVFDDVYCTEYGSKNV
jgi:hypothetical protein